jgi:hypothetical protein
MTPAWKSFVPQEKFADPTGQDWSFPWETTPRIEVARMFQETMEDVPASSLVPSQTIIFTGGAFKCLLGWKPLRLLSVRAERQDNR